MLRGKCIRNCTIPNRGFVEIDEVIVFDLPEWDEKEYSYLKHFQSVGEVSAAPEDLEEAGEVVVTDLEKDQAAIDSLINGEPGEGTPESVLD